MFYNAKLHWKINKNTDNICAVVVPFELVKIRLQDRASAGKYNGAMDCVRQILKNEGPLGLYAGLEPTFWRHVFWNGGYFGCIFQVRALLPKPKVCNFFYVSAVFNC